MLIGLVGSLPRLAAQPAGLTATEAVLGAFHELAVGFAEIEDQVRELATLTRSSETLERLDAAHLRPVRIGDRRVSRTAACPTWRRRMPGRV